ncbi:MAG: iron-containing alcohol dehydrogenase [Spirochaetales bacterium]|nr:iron-containing alcohol dehydrogenase [Spirochaetales bacterium]
MSPPILQSAEVFELIARGDLTKHMNSKRSDEIGLLAKPAENTTDIAAAIDEIRKLGELSAQKSKDISLTIKEITSKISGATEMTNATTGIVEEVWSGLKEVTDSFVETMNGLNEMSAGSGQIVDAMAHVFDVAYFSKKPKMDMLNRMMEEILRTVFRFAPVALREPGNYEARANLMWASSWALNDFLQCGSFEAASCHAMEHELSAFYDITHGLGLAILIPRWMEHVLDDSNATQFKTFGVNVLGLDASLPEREGVQGADSGGCGEDSGDVPVGCVLI